MTTKYSPAILVRHRHCVGPERPNNDSMRLGVNVKMLRPYAVYYGLSYIFQSLHEPTKWLDRTTNLQTLMSGTTRYAANESLVRVQISENVSGPFFQPLHHCLALSNNNIFPYHGHGITVYQLRKRCYSWSPA
jgi:hypothetical protein